MNQEIYTLWQGRDKPHYKKNDLQEYVSTADETLGCVFNITEPTLTVYKAVGENTRKAVIILPGGGYEFVAIQHEGHDLAKRFAAHGITASVLKYRLPNPKTSDQPHLVPLTDARRALKLLKEKAHIFNFEKNQVGMIGFSAGSHLAAMTSLWQSNDADESPSFTALIYGVTMLTDETQHWLETALYFRKLTTKEIAQNHLIRHVSENTPPTFMVHAYDDDICPVAETTRYAQVLFENNISVEVHLFPKGGHGFGMGRKEDGTDQWVQLFINWLRRLDSKATN